MKRIVSLFLVIALLMSCGIAFAADESDSKALLRNSNYFDLYGIVLNASGGGVVEFVFTVAGVGMCSTLGVVNYMVQKYENGGWVDMTGLLPGETISNDVAHVFARSYAGVKGGIYRVTCTFISINSYGVGTKSFTSVSITAK